MAFIKYLGNDKVWRRLSVILPSEVTKTDGVPTDLEITETSTETNLHLIDSSKTKIGDGVNLNDFDFSDNGVITDEDIITDDSTSDDSGGGFGIITD